MGAIIVFTNVPDREAGSRIAEALIAGKLAACVNILAECTSIYRWQGAVETAAEFPLMIKTRAEMYEDVEALIRSLHPYELPEIIAVPVEAGSPAFLDWIKTQTTIESD